MSFAFGIRRGTTAKTIAGKKKIGDDERKDEDFRVLHHPSTIVER